MVFLSTLVQFWFSRTFRAVVEVSNEHVEEPSLVKVFLAHAHIAPIPAGLAVVGVVSTADHVVITSSPDQPSAACPTCARMSQRLHSRYRRILADLPWQGRPVALQVVARRFRCLNPSCARQTFAERLVGAPAAARRTRRLSDLQGHLAGGEAGRRLAVQAIRSSVSALTGMASLSASRRPASPPAR